ncbi:MAG: hypothetical protein IKZ06_00180, partial [Oscillospiraceae bacterium]|nr:hypothetical protein [Oscillospiraceae bacterium]
ILGTEKFTEIGETKTMIIDAKDFPDTQIIQLVIKYDSEKIKLLNVSDGTTEGCEKGRVIGAAGEMIPDAIISSPHPGEVDIVWEGINAISGSGNLVTLEFESLVENAGEVKLEISDDPKDVFIIRANSDDTTNIETEIVEEVKGVKVSGSFTSYLDSAETVKVQLFKTGESAASYEVNVTGNTGSYSIEAVEAGSYIMKVSKEKHAPREYEITVESEDIVQDVKIYLYGDINGDGYVKTNDKTWLARHLAEWVGYETLPVYEAVADLNGDGYVKTNDKTILARYLAEWTGYEVLPKK